MPDNRYPGLALPKDSNDWIRVAELLPGRFDTEIQLHLHTTRLDEHAKYEALSYTWGASTEAHEVKVGDKWRVPVTNNLYRALWRLRHRRESSRMLWIDAICINQHDALERGQQVAIMGQIYSRALHVNIWLGEPAAALSVKPVPTSFVLLIFHYARKAPTSGIALRMASAVKKREHQLLASAVQASDPPWHERAWTVQEYLLARRILLLFGSCAWTLDDFEVLSRVLSTADSTISRYAPDPQYWQPLRDRLIERGSDLQTAAESGVIPDLTDMLHLIQHAQATDKRDLVYSMLGLISKTEAALIGADYALPYAAVCAKATYASIYARNDHKIMRSVDPYLITRPEEFASWVVDFSSAKDLGRSTEFFAPEIILGDFKPSQPFETAQLDLITRQLTLSGVNCGAIKDIRRLSISWDFYKLMSWIEDAVVLRFGKESSPAADALMKRALLKRYAVPSGASGRDKDLWYSLAAFVALGLREPSKELALRLHTNAINDSLRFWDEYALSLSKGGRAFQFVQTPLHQQFARTSDVLHEVTLFVLSNGLIGLALSTVVVGDNIIAAPCRDGKTSPFFVLRNRSDGNYSFRGMAYVHGCMHEEFWRHWQALDEMEERFVLA